MKKSDEEQWSLKHKLVSFEVEKKSFEKEKEFLRNQISMEQLKVQVIWGQVLIVESKDFYKEKVFRLFFWAGIFSNFSSVVFIIS